MKKKQHTLKKQEAAGRGRGFVNLISVAVFLLALAAIGYLLLSPRTALSPGESRAAGSSQSGSEAEDVWIRRAYEVDQLYHAVYTPCWEGAYGAIGDAYLFRATNDSSLMKFHLTAHDLRSMCAGRWVDDRAWICLAELAWYNSTGKRYPYLVEDAAARYVEARREGRLSDREGFWSWYNWPPVPANANRLFTNSNMNQMATVACGLYEATGEQRYLDDALLVWRGNAEAPGIEKIMYGGNGLWKGKEGLAAFGKQLPWNGVEYCSLAAALYRSTKDVAFRNIAISTVRRALDPANGWVDPSDYYQISMDGNGAFVNFILDAYLLAPDSLPEIPVKVERMLDHVWTNHERSAAVVLHRESDHGIRNGWNPGGGEDGYGVDEIGTVHAQGEAARAFGIFAYVHKIMKTPLR